MNPGIDSKNSQNLFKASTCKFKMIQSTRDRAPTRIPSQVCTKRAFSSKKTTLQFLLLRITIELCKYQPSNHSMNVADERVSLEDRCTGKGSSRDLFGEERQKEDAFVCLRYDNHRTASDRCGDQSIGRGSSQIRRKASRIRRKTLQALLG